MAEDWTDEELEADVSPISPCASSLPVEVGRFDKFLRHGIAGLALARARQHRRFQVATDPAVVIVAPESGQQFTLYNQDLLIASFTGRLRSSESVAGTAEQGLPSAARRLEPQ